VRNLGLYRTTRIVTFGLPLFLFLWGPGCGGIVKDAGSVDGGDGVGTGEVAGAGGRSGSGQGAGNKTTGAGKASIGGNHGTVATCGDGVLQDKEECDGTQLGGATCGSVTMGFKPAGTLRCSAACTWNISGCVGPNGSGGKVGTGGFTGATGGAIGAAGSPVTVDSCVNTPSILGSDCTSMCGCGYCPGVYAACKEDGGCAWILECAHGVGCASLQQCYATGCSSIIDRAGGMNSSGAVHADSALACLAKSGCGIACP
jgi:hypothetical protein